MVSEWKIQAIGRSRDGRTNVWRVTPGCGHTPFNPPTTMLAVQVVECEKCSARAITDYNAGTVTPWEKAT